MAANVWQALALVFAWLAFTGWCYRQPIQLLWSARAAASPSGQRPLLLAYASESGHARGLAQQYQQLSENGRLLTLNQLTTELLADSDVLIFASTTGEGDAPANGSRFVEQNGAAKVDLSNTRYAVMALGDLSYSRYCEFGLAVHQHMQQLGAQPLFDAVCVDDMNRLDIGRFDQQLAASGFGSALADVTDVAGLALDSASNAAQISEWPLVQRDCLNPGSSAAPVFDLVLDLPVDHPAHWQAGDVARLYLSDATGETVSRDYTIASLTSEQSLRLLVRQQSYLVDENKRSLGLGSGWLTHNMAIGDRARFEIIHKPHFHAPGERVPMILIGNGTGLAGLRAHLQQRAAAGAPANWLIFGERTIEHDAIWQDELANWYQSGTLERLDLTFSRSSSEELVANRQQLQGTLWHGYVQHAIEQQSEQIRSWLDSGAMIYLCGSRAGMASGVDKVLRTALGNDYVDDLDASGRYRRDVY